MLTAAACISKWVKATLGRGFSATPPMAASATWALARRIRSVWPRLGTWPWNFESSA